MQIPVNDTHFFIVFPVLIGLALDTYMRYKKTGNISTLYISLGSLFLGLGSFFWAVPSLFTSDPKTLSYFTLVADSFQALFFLMLWLLAIRAFFSTNKLLKIFMYIFVYSITFASILQSTYRTVISPYTTYIVELSSSTYDIVFKDTTYYYFFAAINSISLILLGVYFLRNANSSTSSSQRTRIKAMSLIFILGSLVFIAVPAVPFGTNINLEDRTISIIYVIVLIVLLISTMSRVLNRKKTIPRIPS